MSISPELNLVIAFTGSRDQGLILLKTISSINWELVYKLAIRHRIYHQVYNNIKDIDQVPLEIRNQFANSCNNNKYTLLAIAGETIRITNAFNQEGIAHYFIKGIPLAKIAYSNIDCRPCKDIDIWIKEQDIPKASECLIKLGYTIAQPTYPLNSPQYEYFINHYHDIAFYNNKRQVEVELHFTLDHPEIDYFDFDIMYRQEITINNTIISALPHNYHVLFLMLHGATHAWMRLRWLYDIVKYLETNLIDVKQIINLSKVIGCEHIVFQTFTLINQIFGIKDHTIAAFLAKNNPRGQQLAAIAKQFIAADYEFNVGIYNIMFFKYRFYIVKLATLKKKYTALFTDLFKIDKLFTFIKLSRRWFFCYYLLYPFWVIMFIFKKKNNK